MIVAIAEGSARTTPTRRIANIPPVVATTDNSVHEAINEHVVNDG
jgi:hypothetical protein